MKPVSDFIDAKSPAEIIEIDKVYYNKGIFILPQSIWLKFWTQGTQQAGDKVLERGLIGFPNGMAVQVTIERDTFVEQLKFLIGSQIGNAVMTEEDNKDIYTAFLRENFKYVGEFIKRSIATNAIVEPNNQNQ